MRTIMAVVLTMSCILAGLSMGIAAEPADDTTLYTRVGFHHFKGVHKTTNYMMGTFVPINTKVEILKKKAESIKIRIVESGAEVKIENVEKYSGEDIDGIFERMFSREATDLSAYTPEQTENIMAGTYETGMTKEEIILAIGYPPKHSTPSLDKDEWRYWRDRWDTVALEFRDDVLDRLRD